MANEVARRLRKTMTSQEVKVWVHLRSWRKHGYHFRRQAPRQGYVVDFVCLKHKLVVEIDGGQHNFDAHKARDDRRDSALGREGLRVLRFWNSDVDRILAARWNRLIKLCERHPTRPPSAATLPLRGRDSSWTHRRTKHRHPAR